MAGRFKNDRKLMRDRARTGLDVLRKQPNVDTGRLAAMGYCFGGQASLELARSGADLAGIVSFHGALDTPTPQDAKNITGKVLACHGAADPFVPPDHVAAFQKEMEDAKVDSQFISYGPRRGPRLHQPGQQELAHAGRRLQRKGRPPLVAGDAGLL